MSEMNNNQGITYPIWGTCHGFQQIYIFNEADLWSMFVFDEPIFNFGPFSDQSLSS